MSPFNTEDFQEIALLERILAAVSSFTETQKQSNLILEKILNFMSTNPPVSQASFDTALAAFNAAFNTLLTLGQSIGTALTNLEASLTAAQGSTGPVDLSAELATIQNLQSEVTAATSSAQALLTGVPVADQPTSTGTVTASVKKA